MVWRQEHPEHKGHFAYKMYGRFDDVTALEFLEVQVNQILKFKAKSLMLIGRLDT